MSLIEFIQIDGATGAYVGTGSCPTERLASQEVNGLMVFAFSGSEPVVRTIVNGRTTIEVDLVWLKPALYARIDTAAEIFCKSFVTPGETQMVRYQRKEAQARAYLADSNASVPMLEAEAAATGVTVATLAATVVATADAWGIIMDMVEGARIGAKKAVLDAATAPEAVLASQVDWQGLLP